MKAYKVFDENWKCRDFVYEVGKTYNHDGEFTICNSGFHACEKLVDCFSYYTFDPKNKVAEVELFGEIQKQGNDSKLATNIIKIVKELSWNDVLAIVNIGIGNTGAGNAGSWNAGIRNAGNCNAGIRNAGGCNAGSRNAGNDNAGSWNAGNCNAGSRNAGSWNAGNCNAGIRNAGGCNAGSRNAGNDNAGSWNAGNENAGSWNAGNCNAGSRNAGSWNAGSCNAGYFNSKTPLYITVFNKKILKSKWDKADKPSFLYFNLTVFISFDTATDEEKIKYKKEIETCSGFLKALDYKEAFQASYAKASQGEKDLLLKLPNFDADVFYEISGIRV